VGPSGQLLNGTLESIGLPRSSVFVTNVVACGIRVTDKQGPPADAIRACAPRLQAEIASVQPKVILAAGSTAAQGVLANKRKITHQLGAMQWNDTHNAWVIPTYHPAYILRQPSNDGFEDFHEAVVRTKRFADGTIPAPVLDEGTYEHVTTTERLLELIPYWATHTKLALDVETQNLEFIRDRLLVVSIATEHAAWSIDAELFDRRDTRRAFSNLLRSDRILWLLHNLQFDYAFFRHVFNVVPKHATDTMAIALGTTERGDRVGLKLLSRQYLNAPFYEDEIDEHLSKQKGRTDWNEIPRPILARYASRDTLYTARLPNALRGVVEEEGTRNLIDNLLVPSQKTFADLHYQGVRIDTSHIEHLIEIWTPIVESRRRVIADLGNEAGWRYDLAFPLSPLGIKMDKILAARDGGGKPYRGKHPLPEELELSASSPKALASFIYDWLGVRPLDVGKTTGKEFLEAYPDLPISRALRDYREMARLLGTYVLGIKEDMWEDGRVHPDFRLFGTVTGRITIKNPEFQTIPSHGMDEYLVNELRALIIPDDDDYLIFNADYKSLEIYVGYERSGDQALLDALNYRGHDGQADFHRAVASRVFKLPPEQITGAQRTSAKRRTFGIMYGSGAYNLSKQDGGGTIEEEQAYLDEFFQTFPAYGAWYNEQRINAERLGYSRTPFDRVRRWPLITKENIKHIHNQAVNFPIQAYAGDLCLTALNKLNPELQRLNLGRCYFTVHDSIVGQLRKTRIRESVAVIRRIMETPPIPGRLSRFPVEIETGPSWGKMSKYTD